MGDDEGKLYVVKGAKVRFIFQADPDFEVDDVLIDGSSVGKKASYTLDVTGSHSINVTFKPVGNYVTDENGTLIDGNKAVTDADKSKWGLSGISSIYITDYFGNNGAVGVTDTNCGCELKKLDSVGAMGLDNPDGKLMGMGFIKSDFEIAGADCSGKNIVTTIMLKGDLYLPTEDDNPAWYQYNRTSNTITRYPANKAVFNDANNDGRYESVTLTIKDGGSFDLDGAVNCKVSDLSGYGIDMVNDNLSFSYSGSGDWEVEFDADAEVIERAECITWNFGDGSEYTSCGMSAGGIMNPVTHTYAAKGEYTVTLIVDGANGIQTVSRTIKPAAEGGGGGDNCFISTSSSGSQAKGSVVILLLMACAISTLFFRKVR
jgi:hypothetical protein